MRLLDVVLQTRHPVMIAQRGESEPLALPSGACIAPALADTPLRYVCDDAVTALCTETAFGDIDLLRDCLAVARMPAERFWVEWSEPARFETMVRLGRYDEGGGSAVECSGALVTSAPDGRSGAIDVCWRPAGVGGFADLAPVRVEFDLDRPDHAKGASALEPDVIALRTGAIPALDEVLSHVVFRLRPEWSAYYRRHAPPEKRRSLAIEAASTVGADFNFVAAFCLLLAAKAPVRERPIDRARLNRRRLREGKPALLSHVELGAYLGDAGDGAGVAVAGDGAGVRAHLVRGHLVRRNDTVFWRRAHLRGSLELGALRSRTVRLRLRAA